MKKFISGVIVGALLFSGVTVFADSASLIGQKVQGLFTIEKNGKKVDDAIIINGTAYAPVRSVAEASGAKLTVEGKKIIMEDVVTPTVKTSAELQADRAKIAAEITKIETNITDLETNVIPMFEAQAKEMSTNGAIAETAKKTADEYKNVVLKQRTELLGLKTQLAEIDVFLRRGDVI
ncbi:hypothetical protein [Paenibacillus odorifer]|uniref:Copper amine oxidase n=1 Tax=Paenibacillus odorifer TaxID=189426 RepID=A0A1R0WUA8_9BACL|nr:hypothetical protein [Paenibacillus odorifer]OMD21165.1 hypothetical protein BJP51_32165 [Paenibacillus odorifer]